MNKMTWQVLLIFSFLLICWGCSDEPTAPESPYLSPSSPENIVTNLESAFQRRDIDAYSALLAPGFVFYFQPDDAAELGFDSWAKDQDVAGTGNLFSTPLVSDVFVNVIHGPAESAGDGFPDGTMKIRITQALLAVDDINGITWLAEDAQDMYLRDGLDEEDLNRWFIIEWRDIPSAALARSPSGGVQETTWGELKSRFPDAASN